MKKCQTEKDFISIEQRNKQTKSQILNKKLKMLMSKVPKIPKILLNIPFNYSTINDKKFQRRIGTNMITNESYTISNIENTNPNYIYNSLSTTHRTKIYQRKKIQFPEKMNDSKEKIDKNNSLSLKKNLNKKASENQKKLKSFKSAKNNTIISTDNPKYLLNNTKFAHKIKKYLNPNFYLDRNNTINEGINEEKEIKTSRYKRININNININLNSINKITNKIDLGDINSTNLNTSRSNNCKIKEYHFLKKLNFDQPHKNFIPNYKTIIKNNKENRGNETRLNNQNKIINRIKIKQNFIYKNFESNQKNRMLKNKNINKLQSKIKNSLFIIDKSKKKSKSFKKSLNCLKATTSNTKIINSNKINKSNINIKNKKLENIESNLITSESLTILDNSISEFINDSKNISRSESEKDEKHTVVTTHQINLFLNKARKSFMKMKPKNIKNNLNNFGNKKINLGIKEKKAEFKNIFFSSINTNFKLLLVKFLDKKSLLVLSSVNKNFYHNLRKKIYKYFYDKIIKNNGNRDHILKILSSVQKYSSKSLKLTNANSLKIKYESYKRCKSKYDIIILQDISRTFPNEANFCVNSINYKKLYNILTAYSNFNKNIGYAQGLNFLAARAIILFKSEEKIFMFLDGLINRFNLEYFLSINNQKLPKQIKYLSQILNKYCKNFINYLKSKFINHDFFTTSWLLTLFSNSMDRKKLYICWCFMIIFGWKFFYSFIIQIILFYENDLMKINEGKLSKQMKEILKCNSFIKDFNNIMKNTLDFMEKNIIL